MIGWVGGRCLELLHEVLDAQLTVAGMLLPPWIAMS